MHIMEEKVIELASYHLKDIAYDWVEMWKKNIGEDAASMTWKLFHDAFFLSEIKEVKLEEFINLRQGSMSVKKYYLKFSLLSKYAPSLMADPRTSMSKFMTRMSSYVVKECQSAMLNREMDLSRLMIHAKQIKADKIKKRERR